jgi:signal peptidase II
MLAGADQWTKGWAVDRMGPLTKDSAGRLRPPWGKPPVEVWEGYLRLNITGNSGAIFGLGRAWPESIKRPIFVVMSCLAMGFIALLIRGSQPDQRLRRLGLAAVLSGALGNLIDRMGQDYVVDFIDWYGGFHWPTFNVADIAITAGVLLVLLNLWLHPDPVPDHVPADPTAATEEDGASPSPPPSGNPSP